MAASPTRASRSKPAAGPDLHRASVGARLREMRKARGLTLKDLSKRSGVALSTLSKMELGQISVSYEKMAAAAHALGVDTGLLFDPRAASADAPAPTVVHATLDGSPSYDSPTYTYRALASDYPRKRMTPMHGVIRARDASEFSDFIRHPGQEFVMVLSGSVRIAFETGESLVLKRQESAYFDSGVGHIYLSLGRQPAELLVVMAEG